jgi:transposase
VLEAGWNWGVMYDWLAAIDNVEQVELAHPFSVRAIAAAQIKTDAIDAHTLAQLLRSNLIPRAYIPGVETGRLREIVRQRVFLVRVRTMVKNRIHALLDRYHVPAPAVSDIFGKRGRDCLAKVELPAGAQQLLRQDLALLEALSREVHATEQWLRDSVRGDHRVELLRTVSRVGRSARHRGGPGNRPRRALRLRGQAGGLRRSGSHHLFLGWPDLPRQADAANQQVVTLGAGGSGLGSSQTQPVLPHPLR